MKPQKLHLSSSHAEPAHAGETRKMCVNVYAEASKTIPGIKNVLRPFPGAVDRDEGSVISGPIRGMFQVDGFAGGAILIVDGSTVRTYKNGVWAELAGSLPGTDRVTAAFSETQCAFLSDGKIYVSNGESIRHATDGLTVLPLLQQGEVDAAKVKLSDFVYLISETKFAKTVSEVDVGNDIIPAGRYGAIALDIDAAGNIEVVSAQDNAIGYSTASLAVLGLPEAHYTKVRVGWLTVRKLSGSFRFGTTLLDDSDVDLDIEFKDGQLKSTGINDLLELHGVETVSSITSLGQRLVFTYGSRFGFSDPFDFGKTSEHSWYTSERFPDENVACFANGSALWICCTDSFEPWYETGDGDKPFQPYSSQEIPELGLLSAHNIISTGKTIIFITPEHVVMAMTDASPTPISPNWVSRALEGKEIQMMAHTFEGHVFIYFRTPDMCIVYDATTNEWPIRQSYQSDTWQFEHMVEVAGKTYVASDGAFAQLDKNSSAEFDQPIIAEGTGHFPMLPPGTEIGTIQLLGTVGVGADAMEIAISLDGQTKGNYRPREQGVIGQYGTRPSWHRNNSARHRPVVLYWRSVLDPSFMLQSFEWGG